jgi:hypothetical protein
MRKLLLSALLMTLPSCSTPSPKTPSASGACRIPRLQFPDVVWNTCGQAVCLSKEDSILVSRHFRAAIGTQEALEACALVELTP